MLLHPRRAVVLHALALAAGAREPLDRGFAALAAGDRLLAPWEPRLCPALAAGEDLAAVLRRRRLVGRDEAELIASDGDTGGALRRVADGIATALPGALLARWFVSCLAATLGIGVLTGSAMANLWFGQAYRDLNIRLPMGLGGLGSWLELLFLVGSICLAIWGFGWLFLLAQRQAGGPCHHPDGTADPARRIGGPPDLQLFWAPESCQAAAMHRCLISLRLGREGEAWAAWVAWWSLSRWRLPPPIRHGIAAEPVLERRLLALGILACGPRGPDWGAACDSARAALADALATEAPLLRMALLIGLVASALGALVAPLLEIITQLNGAS